MGKSKKLLVALGATLALVIAFGAGYRIVGDKATHLEIHTGYCRTTADAASCQVGDTWYAFEQAVTWTDDTGAQHSPSWPDCLPKGADIKDLRFAAAVLWVQNDFGVSQVVWVDCRGR
jgi:hypothetical protein